MAGSILKWWFSKKVKILQKHVHSSIGCTNGDFWKIEKTTSQKPCKVCKNGKMTSQKYCKVCKNAKWPVTTMGSQRFVVSKTQYVCHCFFDIALTMGSQRFFFAKINFPFDLWRGGRSERSGRSERNGYMESGSEPGYTRPSHEDGTFTTANSLKWYSMT